MDRSTVANALRLLRLPEKIQEMVESGRLSAGHGRALLALPDDQSRLEWAERAVAEGLSVRDLERVAADGQEADRRARGGAKKHGRPRTRIWWRPKRS